jgi:hypothetical protein
MSHGYQRQCCACGAAFQTKNKRQERCGPCARTARKLNPVMASCMHCGTWFAAWAGGASHARKCCSDTCRTIIRRAHRAFRPPRPRQTPEVRKLLAQAWYARNRDRLKALGRIAARARYHKNPRAGLEKTRRWKRANRAHYATYMRDFYRAKRDRNPQRRRELERVALWPCLGCGSEVPSGRILFCSTACARREAKALRSLGLSFIALRASVFSGVLDGVEAREFTEAWRALRAARRAIHTAQQGSITA